MLQKIYGVYADELENCNFFAEAGLHHFACWCRDAETGIVKAFELFQFSNPDEQEWKKILNEIKQNSKLYRNNYVKVSIIYNTQEAVCVPTDFYKPGNEAGLLEQAFGNTRNKVFNTQSMDNKVIVSSIHKVLAEILRNELPGAVHVHKFYTLLKDLPGGKPEETAVSLIFYTNYFIAVVKKDGILQFIRGVGYQTPEDVLYHLLNLCRQYNMQINDTTVYISGAVDRHSSLYNILYQYVEHLEIETTPATIFGAEGFSVYPSQFFTPFFSYTV